MNAASALKLASIVEGQGDYLALPLLVRRVCQMIEPDRYIEVLRPIRVRRDQVIKKDELERYVELAARAAGGGGALLILLDADDDCPAELGPKLVERSLAVRPELYVSVVLANREFEAWFLAAARSLGGKRGLPEDLGPPADAEAIRDAKGWIQAQRIDGFAYSPTADQPALASIMDIQQARTGAPSFDKFWRELEGMLSHPPS